jgi:CRP/FNR family transcriptional regulator
VIGPEDFVRLSALAFRLDVSDRQAFMTEGEPAEHFFTMTQGVAKLFKLMPDGRRQITGFARPGDFIGLAAGVSGYASTAEAVGAVRLCRFNRSQLRLLLDDFPQMEEAILAAASSELAAAQAQMMVLGRKTSRERLATFLLSWRGSESQETATMPLPITRQDIADYLGLTIETVSRCFTGLRHAGLIALPAPGEVTLLEPTQLAAVAEGAAICPAD